MSRFIGLADGSDILLIVDATCFTGDQSSFVLHSLSKVRTIVFAVQIESGLGTRVVEDGIDIIMVDIWTLGKEVKVLSAPASFNSHRPCRPGQSVDIFNDLATYQVYENPLLHLSMTCCIALKLR